MSEKRYFVTNIKELSFDNPNNFSFESPNEFEFDPFSELRNNSPKEESSSNLNDHNVYFHNNNKKIPETNNETIRDNNDEEINDIINNNSEEKYKNNPFVQKKMINEATISRKDNFENDKKLSFDLTSQKNVKNISQKKQNKNINQINFNLNVTNLECLLLGTTQSIKSINNNNFLGKKRESYNITFSDKYIKKVRILLITAIITFINELIKKFTNNNIGKGSLEMQFVKIDKKKLTHSSVEYDKEFLNKALKEIISSISEKYTQYNDDKNKKIIQDLLKLEEKGKYFQKLFDLSFLDFLKHISGKENNELLIGFPTIEHIIKKEMKSLSRYDIDVLKSCFMNYKDLVDMKKSRNPKNNKK